MKMVKKILILDTPGCSSCKYAEELIERIKKEGNIKIDVEVKDITKHPELLQKYQIMSAPGIVIDGELKFTGKPSEKELRKALKE
jgi:glutaredoxin